MDEETNPEKVTNVAPILEELETVENQQPAPVASSPKPKKTKILACLIVLLFVFSGVGIYYVTRETSTEPVNNTETSEKPAETPVAESKLRLENNDLSDFDLAFLKLENDGENKAYSPLSIKYALAMLKDGANGDSKAQIENLIGDYSPKSYLNSENRSLANALFIRDTFSDSILDSYKTTVSKNYNAEVLLDSFASATVPNNWISDRTLGILNNFFDDDYIKDKDFILVNALAIDMSWNNQLQCAPSLNDVPCRKYNIGYAHENYHDYVKALIDTANEFDVINFNGHDNTKAAEIGASVNRYDIIKEIGEDKIRETVSAELDKWLSENPTYADDYKDKEAYLNQYIKELSENLGRLNDSTDFYFSDNDSEKVFAKDLKEYDGSTLQYVGIMPKDEELGSYVEKLDAEKATALIKNLKDASVLENYKEGVVTKITGHIPFFKFGRNLKLEDDLKELGVTDVFDKSKADLSNMTSSSSFISAASHKADIEFSNDGIKAVAATAFGGSGATGGGFDYLWDVPVEEIDLTFDKPYLFLIRDKSSGEIWFTGTVYNPTEQS